MDEKRIPIAASADVASGTSKSESSTTIVTSVEPIPLGNIDAAPASIDNGQIDRDESTSIETPSLLSKPYKGKRYDAPRQNSQYD